MQLRERKEKEEITLERNEKRKKQEEEADKYEGQSEWMLVAGTLLSNLACNSPLFFFLKKKKRHASHRLLAGIFFFFQFL